MIKHRVTEHEVMLLGWNSCEGGPSDAHVIAGQLNLIGLLLLDIRDELQAAREGESDG